MTYEWRAVLVVGIVAGIIVGVLATGIVHARSAADQPKPQESTALHACISTRPSPDSAPTHPH